MKRFTTTLLIVFAIFLLTGCEQQQSQTFTTVVGIVTNMEHEDSQYIPIPYYNTNTKQTTIKFQFFPEHNYVTIAYDNLSQTFDDKELYNKVAIGDSVEVILHEVFEKGNIVARNLELE